VKQAVEHLAELPTYASDGAPDVFVFTFSTLRVSLIASSVAVYYLNNGKEGKLLSRRT
jgi:hypothetical protein